jgi:hypothetical protein
MSMDRLRDPSDADLDRLDIAEVDLACADGLPGSERLDVPACLAWVDRAAAWALRHTLDAQDQFARSPADYDHSEGIFRVVALMSVLQRGMGARYNPRRIADPEAPPADSRDTFIHGIIAGPGGTCASLPVLYAAVGRRLGYPLRLVETARHLFVRWDDPAGERFNVEINATGLNTHPDEHYLDWPVPIRETPWREETRYLRSMTPREEVARAWAKRGLCLHANGRLGEAVDAFATVCSIVTDDRSLDRAFWRMLQRWRRDVAERAPAGVTPRVHPPPRRQYPGLPAELERQVIELEALAGIAAGPAPRPGRATRCALN